MLKYETVNAEKQKKNKWTNSAGQEEQPDEICEIPWKKDIGESRKRKLKTAGNARWRNYEKDDGTDCSGRAGREMPLYRGTLCVVGADAADGGRSLWEHLLSGVGSEKFSYRRNRGSGTL